MAFAPTARRLAGRSRCARAPTGCALSAPAASGEPSMLARGLAPDDAAAVPLRGVDGPAIAYPVPEGAALATPVRRPRADLCGGGEWQCRP